MLSYSFTHLLEDHVSELQVVGLGNLSLAFIDEIGPPSWMATEVEAVTMRFCLDHAMISSRKMDKLENIFIFSFSIFYSLLFVFFFWV